jgi:tetratricopeptide (TPR) repeat protein
MLPPRHPASRPIPGWCPMTVCTRRSGSYLLAALSARLGNEVRARRYAAELLRLDTTTTQGVIGRALGHEVLAYAEGGGRKAEALAQLDQSGLRGPQARIWERAYCSPVLSQAHGRYFRAGILSGLGREAEALRWYNSMWMANAFDLAYLAPAHLRQAEILDRVGQRERALQHYRAFAELWKDADPGLRWRVDRVESRITELVQRR